MKDIKSKFWEFVDFVDWMKLASSIDFEQFVLDEVAKKYTWKEFREFDNIYRVYYDELRERLRDIWLSDDNHFGPSDDGFTDLCSSIVGKGQTFCEFMCSTDDELVYKEYLDMAETGDYYENFGYIFHFGDEGSYKKANRIEKLNQLDV